MVAGYERLREIVRALDEARVRTCVFVEPEVDQIKANRREPASDNRGANRGPTLERLS